MIHHRTLRRGSRALRRISAWRFAARLALPLLVVLVFTSTAGAAVYYVDAARPDDSGDGSSWATAKQTVQAGIGVAAPGDTILVKYGLYAISAACSLTTDRMMTSDDGSHNAWDTATPDSSQCILSADGSCRVLTIKGGTVTVATRVRGFKLAGGIATTEGIDPDNAYGGGVLIAEGADAVIERCWITGNTAGTSYNGYGGGIACTDEGTAPTIRHCRVEFNIASTVSQGCGGGIYCGSGTSVEIHDDIISDNTAATNHGGYGGGIYCTDAVADIGSNIVSSNTASGTDGGGAYGGGIYAFAGTVEIWGNTVTYNRAAVAEGGGGYGGGIWCNSDNSIIRDNPDISYNIASVNRIGYGGGLHIGGVTVSGNTITHNKASTSTLTSAYFRQGTGGGIHAPGVGNIITGNVISENTASAYGEGKGGGIYFDTGASITRNIISLNTASGSSDGYGGGTYSYNASAAELINNTFYRNASSTEVLAIGDGSAIHHASGGVPDVANNIFTDHDVAGSDSLAIYSGTAITITNNCFFNNPVGNYNVNVTSLNEIVADPRVTDAGAGDFSLRYDSPCIEEGDPAYPLPENGGWVVDIGAIEYTGTRHMRTVTGTGELLFGGMVRAKVDVTTLGTLSEIDMVVHPGEFYPLAPVSVERWYAIDHAGDGMAFDLTLSYLEDELKGRAEDSLSVWRWAGNAWDGPKAYSTRDLDDNWIAVSGQTAFSDWIITDDWGPTAVDDGLVPAGTRLSVNYPNPFNPTTTIAYSLDRPAHVKLCIYDAMGRVVRVLVDERQRPDRYEIVWDGCDGAGSPSASGVYFLRLRAGDVRQMRKMVLVR